jgi:hypothetical protein
VPTARSGSPYGNHLLTIMVTEWLRLGKSSVEVCFRVAHQLDRIARDETTLTNGSHKGNNQRRFFCYPYKRNEGALLTKLGEPN